MFLCLHLFAMSACQGAAGPAGPPGEAGHSGNPGFVNVREYGAAGDGVADDTAAIQAAVTAAAKGGVVYVPGGVYRIRADRNGDYHGVALGSNLTFEMSPAAILRAIPTHPTTW